MPPSRPLTERFWEKVDRRGPDECWPWTASTSRGYGQIGSCRTMLKAHRVSYELHNDPVPDGLDVLHSCDNPPCCNPTHLFLGTHQDNMDDKVEKRRQSRGETNGQAKLTEDQVDALRREYIKGSRTRGQHALARKYGVHQTHIRRIVRGESWV